MIALIVALAIAALLVWGFWAAYRRSPDSVPADEAALLGHCLGDRPQMERLIAAEGKQWPGLARTAAIRRALWSVRRDSQG